MCRDKKPNQDHQYIERANDNEFKQAQSKEQITEIEQTRKTLIITKPKKIRCF